MNVRVVTFAYFVFFWFCEVVLTILLLRISTRFEEKEDNKHFLLLLHVWQMPDLGKS